MLFIIRKRHPPRLDAQIASHWNKRFTTPSSAKRNAPYQRTHVEAVPDENRTVSQGQIHQHRQRSRGFASRASRASTPRELFQDVLPKSRDVLERTLSHVPSFAQVVRGGGGSLPPGRILGPQTSAPNRLFSAMFESRLHIFLVRVCFYGSLNVFQHLSRC